MNRTVALLLLLLVVTNGAWMIFAGRPPEPEHRPTPAPTADPDREGPTPREEEMAAEIVRLKERLARHEPPRPAPSPAPDPARAEREKAAEEAQNAEREMYSAARKQANEWIADLKQIDDPALRSQALDEIRAALSSSEQGVVLAGLFALNGAWGVDFDRTSFRPLVTPLLGSGSALIRTSAVPALLATSAGAESLALVLPMADDPDPRVRRSVPGVIVRLSGYRPDETVGRALARLLSSEDSRVRSAAIDAMSGIRELPVPLEEKLLQMATSKDRRIRQRVLFALGRLGKKSDRVVDVLLPYLKEDHWNARLVAYRGLEHGVPESSKKRVADAIVQAAPKLPDYNNLWRCFRILNGCGDRTHFEAMERLGENPMLSESVRKYYDGWLETLRRRVGS